VTQPLSLLLSAGLLLAPHAPSPDPEPPTSSARDQKAMQGDWKVVTMERDGKPEPAAEAEKYAVAIKDDKIIVKEAGRDEEASFALDARKNPRHITIKPRGDKQVLGIYKLDKDTLTICFNKDGAADRPKEFSTKGKMGYSLIVLKRAKK
jgi:uncharacterized protein (TIGR03067 family)